MKSLHKVTFILLVIGGLNWLLFIFGWDVGSLIGDSNGLIAKIIYALVGISAILEIVGHKSNCRQCEKKGSSVPQSSAPAGSNM